MNSLQVEVSCQHEQFSSRRARKSKRGPHGDMNNTSHPRTDEELTELGRQHTYIAVVTCCLIGILILLTLLGNLLIMTAFCFCKELRTITNYFLLSLSLADLLTALFAMPIFMASTIVSEKLFLGGVVYYEVWRSIDIICGTASIWNLCLVSIDRFLAVSCPIKHMVILTPVRAKTAIFLVWTLSTGISGLIHLNWTYRGVLITVISFFLPLVVIIFSYIKIYQVTTRSCALRRSGGKQLKRDIYSAKQMVLVISVFIVCWFGFFLLTLMLSTKKSLTIPIYIRPVVLNILKALTYLNSCINPILFTFVSNKYKKAVSCILRCQRPNLSQRRNKCSRITRQLERSILAPSFSQKSTNFRPSSNSKGNYPCKKAVSIINRETTV